MALIVIIISSIISLFLGQTFWQVYKRKGLVNQLLRNQTILDNYAKRLKQEGLLDETDPQKIVSTGKLYSENYGQNILIEGKSSQSALNRTLVMFLLIELVNLGISYYFGHNLVVISLVVFVLTFLFPVGKPAFNSGMIDLKAIFWNLYWYKTKKPEEFKEFINTAVVLQKANEALDKV
ncbi:MAG TPA: hypothetical protein VMR41_01195 [Patescibacteria group bacterium]|nr:hypothetical protein [Patescibacteria group bacterium]